MRNLLLACMGIIECVTTFAQTIELVKEFPVTTQSIMATQAGIYHVIVTNTEGLPPMKYLFKSLALMT